MKLPVWRGPDLALRKRHLRLGGLSWSLCLACIFILSACSGLEKNEQPQFTALRSLTSGQQLGQSFVPRYDGLQAVSIYLSPGNPAARQVLLEIKDQPGGSEVLRTAALNLIDSSAPGYYRFDFQPIPDSNLKYLYLEFQLEGTSGLQVGTAPAQSYMNGSLYENGIPVEAQLSFHLSYQSRYALTGLIKEFLTWVYRLFIGILFFMIPGWAVASLLVKSWNSMSWLEKAAIGISASLAIYPLFLLWTDVLGMHLGVSLRLAACHFRVNHHCLEKSGKASFVFCSAELREIPAFNKNIMGRHVLVSAIFLAVCHSLLGDPHAGCSYVG